MNFLYREVRDDCACGGKGLLVTLYKRIFDSNPVSVIRDRLSSRHKYYVARLDQKGVKVRISNSRKRFGEGNVWILSYCRPPLKLTEFSIVLYTFFKYTLLA